jgi:hypothetical protein
MKSSCPKEGRDDRSIFMQPDCRRGPCLVCSNPVPVLERRGPAQCIPRSDPRVFQEVNASFACHWKEKTGQAISILMFRGDSVPLEGEIEQVGSPEDKLDRPATSFIYQFSGNTNQLSCRICQRMAEINGIRLAVPEYASVTDAPGIACFRPHDVEIDLPTGKGGSPAVIQDISFGGPILKVHLVQLGSGQNITAAIHRDRWQQLGLEIDGQVVIRLGNVKVFLAQAGSVSGPDRKRE